jgi:hypothetical protein
MAPLILAGAIDFYPLSNEFHRDFLYHALFLAPLDHHNLYGDSGQRQEKVNTLVSFFIWQECVAINCIHC